MSNEIGDIGVLKLTIHKFYRITGGSTQYKGFAPDIVLPSLFQHLQSGEKYLDYSLPWDQIGPVKYTSFNNKPFDLEMIRKMSLRRVELALRQFDMAYFHFKAKLGEMNGISHVEGEELMDEGRELVMAFSDYTAKLSKRIRFRYYTPREISEFMRTGEEKGSE